MSAPLPPLLPVEEALQRILDTARHRSISSETLPLSQCAGRVLSASVTALRSQPPADLSSMDGYALLAADTDPPGKPLAVIGESAAGHPFAGRVTPGQCTRIFTGARLPDGADAVLLQERADRTGDVMRPEIAIKSGTFIRRKGIDFSRGDVGLAKGTRLKPGHLALAASMNHPTLDVSVKPLIAIMATGDELVPPGGDPSGQSTVASSVYSITALLEAAGALVLDLGIIRDDREALKVAFGRARAAKAACLVTLGGASVGDHDLVRPVAAELGAAQSFYRIAMRPGKPLNFGTIGEMLLLGLPGNPVSTMVCAHLFLLPLLGALQGDASAGMDQSQPARLGYALKENDERQDYLRARLELTPDGWLATPFERQDSSLELLFSKADALIIRKPHAPAADTGDLCRILRI